MSPFDAASLSENIRTLYRAMRTLTAKQSLVIQWIYWDRIDKKTIASCIGVTYQQVWRIESQAIIKLKYEYKVLECIDRRGLLVYDYLRQKPWEYDRS